MPYGYANPATSPTGSSTTSTGETFLQRQMRLKGQSQQQPAQQPQQQIDNGVVGTQIPQAASQPSYAMGPTTGTPVQGNGQIPSPAPQVAIPPPAPAPKPAPAPRAMTTQEKEAAAGIEERPGNNLVYVPSYGGVVDRNNPIYQNAIAQFDGKTTTDGGGAAAGPANSDEQGRGQASKSGMFTQYQAPDHDFENWQQLQMLDQILANPETLSPHVIDQLMQKMTEGQLSMSQQLGDQESDDLIGRGFSPNGGTAEAQSRARNENMEKAILGGRRDLEVQASQQNRQDQLNALQAAEGVLQGQTGRSGQVYGNVLNGEQANRDDYYKGKGLDLQEKLGMGGLNIDQQRVNQQGSEFNDSHALDILKFLEGGREYDGSQGFNWAQLNQNGQNATWDRIMAAAGIGR